MKCYIDGNSRTSDMFWKEVQVLLSPGQRQRLLDGTPVYAGGREYLVVTDEMMEEMLKEQQKKEKEHKPAKKY